MQQSGSSRAPPGLYSTAQLQQQAGPRRRPHPLLPVKGSPAHPPQATALAAPSTAQEPTSRVAERGCAAARWAAFQNRPRPGMQRGRLAEGAAAMLRCSATTLQPAAAAGGGGERGRNSPCASPSTHLVIAYVACRRAGVLGAGPEGSLARRCRAVSIERAGFKALWETQGASAETREDSVGTRPWVRAGGDGASPTPTSRGAAFGVNPEPTQHSARGTALKTLDSTQCKITFEACAEACAVQSSTEEAHKRTWYTRQYGIAWGTLQAHQSRANPSR